MSRDSGFPAKISVFTSQSACSACLRPVTTSRGQQYTNYLFLHRRSGWQFNLNINYGTIFTAVLPFAREMIFLGEDLLFDVTINTFTIGSIKALA